jgi:membrane protease YdiL (CAAX protease family)
MGGGSKQGSATAPQGSSEAGARSWRDSKFLALGELGIVALIFIADHYIRVWHLPRWVRLLWISQTPYLFLLAWISLRLRKLRWSDVGLRRFGSWRAVLVYGVGAGIALEVIELFVTQPLLIWLTGEPPNLENFRDVIGNWKLVLIYLPALWVLAAFGEETVHRGYLMNRVADLGNRTRLAWAVSLLLVSVEFGFCHRYQGITGIIDEGLMGFLLGLLYLRCGRNLWIPIVAHGVADSIDLALMYLGIYPTM